LPFPPCPRPPPHPPAPPTRRSSDLHRLGPRRAVLQSEPPREEEPVQIVGPVMMPTRHRRRVQPRPRHEDVARFERLLPEDPGSRDRKSTRLNSSHGSISYAVFCLKK